MRSVVRFSGGQALVPKYISIYITLQWRHLSVTASQIIGNSVGSRPCEYQIRHQNYVLISFCEGNPVVTARFWSPRAVTWKCYIWWCHHYRIWLVSAKPVFTHVTGNTNVTEGDDITFQCQTDGVPAATPAWLVDGKKFSSASSVYTSIYRFSQEYQYKNLP